MKTLKLLNICLIIWVCTVLGEELHFWYLINHRIKIYVEHFCLTNFWVFLLRYKAFWILITCHLYVVPHFHHNYIVWWWLFGLCAGALQDVLHLHDVLARVSLAKLCCTISRARALIFPTFVLFYFLFWLFPPFMVQIISRTSEIHIFCTILLHPCTHCGC